MKPVEIYETAIRVLKPDFETTIFDTDNLNPEEREYNQRFFSLGLPYIAVDEHHYEARLMVNENVKPELDTPRAMFRYGNFLINHGYGVSELTVDIFMALNQLGFMTLDKLMIDHKIVKLSREINDSAREKVFERFTDDELKDISKEGPNLITMLTPEQVWADNYAMTNFPLVYKAINVFLPPISTLEELTTDGKEYIKSHNEEEK